MLIEVTQEHIKQSPKMNNEKLLDFGDNPVARAISATTGNPWRNNIMWAWRHCSVVTELPLPRNAELFMRAWRRGEPVAPFSFPLEIPDAT